MISGSSAPAAHTTITCGSDSSSAIGAVALLAQVADLALRAPPAPAAVRVRVRNSVIAVTTANRMTPSVSASAASSCRSSAAKVSR